MPVEVDKPDGAGPFPAVVFLHGCDGLGTHASGVPRRWAGQLVREGYLVALPDSLTPRGFPDGVCTHAPQEYIRKINILSRAGDAYATLAYLRGRPDVDGKHVAVMGDSFGGGSTLAADFKPVSEQGPLAAMKRDAFTAAVALYPGYAARLGAWSPQRERGRTGPVVAYHGVYEPLAPLLILIGAKDDWTPAEPCRRLSEMSRAAGHDVDIRVYPDVYHAFDGYRPPTFCRQCFNANIPGGGTGATTGSNPEAREAAFRDAKAFLARHLKGG